MFSELIEYSKQSGINPVIEQIEKSKSMMELQMKALVARSIFGMDSYYKVLNNVNNEAYNKAMYVIENWSEIFDKI
jgi:carboxyl-terminal processing protease